MKYLLNNRKHATYWNSTRDTALVVEAFADYLAASGEDKPERDRRSTGSTASSCKEVTITADNLFTFDNKLVLDGRRPLVRPPHGRNPQAWPWHRFARSTSTATSPTSRSKTTSAPPALELKVERRYFKLTPVEQNDRSRRRPRTGRRPACRKVRPQPLVNLAELTSGDLVEVELIVDSKNDYEYILLEDMKAAGFEPVEVRSGYNGNELGAYMELPRRPRQPVRQPPRPRAAQRQLPPPRRNPRPLQRLTHASVRHVRPRTPSQLPRTKTPHRRLTLRHLNSASSLAKSLSCPAQRRRVRRGKVRMTPRPLREAACYDPAGTATPDLSPPLFARFFIFFCKTPPSARAGQRRKSLSYLPLRHMHGRWCREF